MSKLFDIAGVSRVRTGFPLKFRVANGKPGRRARTLERAGCVDIQMFQIEPMTKDQAYAWFVQEHPALAAEVKGKVAATAPAKVEAAPKTAAVKTAAKEVKPEVAVVDVVLSTAAKLALKRAKDAARKREKRAAEKAAKLAAVAA